jgi:hypothetical protein
VVVVDGKVKEYLPAFEVLVEYPKGCGVSLAYHCKDEEVVALVEHPLDLA